MIYNIIGKNIEVTEGLKDAIRSKFNKLEKYFNEDMTAKVTLSVQKDVHTIEVTIPARTLIRAEESDSDMYAAIDSVIDILSKQIKKYKNKLIDKHQQSPSFSDFFIHEVEEEDNHIEIVKVKKFAIKPMDPEEACLQMEMLGHSFYVFLNAQTDEVNVVYKRKNGTYGIIEQER